MEWRRVVCGAQAGAIGIHRELGDAPGQHRKQASTALTKEGTNIPLKAEAEAGLGITKVRGLLSPRVAIRERASTPFPRDLAQRPRINSCKISFFQE